MSESCLYAILGVPTTADQKEIRKAYLKLSLRYHPDKNTDNPEAAKAQFIRIGQAYEILSDPVRRAEYDRSRQPRQRRSQQQQQHRQYHQDDYSYNNNNNYQYDDPRATRNNPSPHEQESYSYRYEFGTAARGNTGNAYETYRQAFDATMANMSEDELRDAKSAAAMIGGVVGSMLGSRLMGNGSNNNTKNFMARNLGSVIGGLVASEAASALVETAHTQARQRATLEQDRRERVARGEVPVEQESTNRSSDQLWKELLQATADVVLQKTVAAMFQGRR